MHEVALLKDLEPGEMFTRERGTFRYIVSNRREEHCGNISIHCYNLDGEKGGYDHEGNERVIRLSGHGPDSKAPARFWMCYVEDGNLPSYRHWDITKAHLEAERLAMHTLKRVFVLTALTSIVYKPAVPAVSAGCICEDTQV